MKRSAKIVAIAAALVLGAVSVLAYQPETVTNGGTILGIVELEGTPPKPRRIEITRDKQVCGARPIYNQDLVVGSGGGIRYAVVTIPGIGKGAPLKPETVKFDQVGCQYKPHVLAFPAGSTVQVINSDGILHNIHTYSKVEPQLNMAQPGFKKMIPVVIKKPDLIRVTCDAHGWMEGWWYSAANPYFAVTGEHGAFTIKDVPPGTYTLEVWQQKLGMQRRKVTVESGQTTNVTFGYRPGKD
jgi:plastocyanin